MKTKLAYIGGGSLFVPSIVNGISRVMQESPLPFEVELSLFDIHPEKAIRMQAYTEVARNAWGIPLYASIATTRQEALEAADVVLVSVWLQEEHARLERLWQRLGREYAEDGLGVPAWAVACAPWMMQVAADLRMVCPGALFLTLMNPTDVLAGLALEAEGVRAAGLCVEVDGLRGALAHYFAVPYEQIELTHAGVNHDGWVLQIKVDGQDGYRLWQDRWQDLRKDPDFHPGNLGMQSILKLTGHLRSSAYHNWPYEVSKSPDESARWERWQGKRAMYGEAVEQAIHTGMPIQDLSGIHPERSRLNYPYTGLTVGKLLQSLATGQPNVIPLQIPNRGAIANFPAEAIVEVPTRAQGKDIQGEEVGELPEWLGGYTRLLAIQRRMIIEYLLERQLSTLKRALAVLPMLASVQELNAYAEALHEEYGNEGSPGG